MLFLLVVISRPHPATLPWGGELANRVAVLMLEILACSSGARQDSSQILLPIIFCLVRLFESDSIGLRRCHLVHTLLVYQLHWTLSFPAALSAMSVFHGENLLRTNV